MPESLKGRNGGGERAPREKALMEEGKSALEAEDEDVLNRLTEKISVRLRAELSADLRKAKPLSSSSVDLAGKLESYMSGELHTHTCQICFEMMVSELPSSPISPQVSPSDGRVTIFLTTVLLSFPFLRPPSLS